MDEGAKLRERLWRTWAEMMRTHIITSYLVIKCLSIKHAGEIDILSDLG